MDFLSELIMTKRVFWEDPYLSRLQTRVRQVNGAIVELEETIFFAFSGGQESDHGSIGQYQVIEAKKVGDRIEYTIADNHELNVGDTVEVCIDWKRRYKLMRLHFAAELTLEIINTKLNHPQRIGSHIGENKARIDFFWHESISPLLPEVLTEVNEIVKKDLEIIKDYSDLQNQIRYWQIPGFAQVPCGGTHIKSTAEVGSLRLKRNNIGKNKERVEIYLS
jgi:Ser-tRNA(Ala) deacylase AlaX